MKRYGLVLGLLLGISTVAWGVVEQPGGSIGLTNAVDLVHSAEPEFGTPEWFEWWRRQHPPVSLPQPAPTLPQVNFNPTPRAEVTLTITPSRPSELDEVTVTVSCSPVGYYYVDRADLQVRGAFLTLDLYWEAAVFFAPISELRHVQPLGAFSPGTYSLMVRNHGPFYGTASTTFTVTALEPDDGGDPMWPSWWSWFYSGSFPW